jgi:hypothetical protein
VPSRKAEKASRVMFKVRNISLKVHAQANFSSGWRPTPNKSNTWHERSRPPFPIRERYRSILSNHALS